MVKLELSLVLWPTVLALSARTPVSKAAMKGGVGSSFLVSLLENFAFPFLPPCLLLSSLPPSLLSFLLSFLLSMLTG